MPKLWKIKCRQLWKIVYRLHDPNDSFYIDKNTGKTRFESDDFLNMLNVIDNLSAGNMPINYLDGIKSGEVLYNFVCINAPTDLFFWNEMRKQDIRVVGFPCNDAQKT